MYWTDHDVRPLRNDGQPWRYGQSDIGGNKSLKRLIVVSSKYDIRLEPGRTAHHAESVVVRRLMIAHHPGLIRGIEQPNRALFARERTTVHLSGQPVMPQ